MFRYAIDFFTTAGEPLGSVPVEPDWEPALEWAQFLGVRQQKLRTIGPNGNGRIEPVWDSSLGKPTLQEVRVQFPPRDGNEEVSTRIPITYFSRLAEEASRRLVESGQLQGGDRFRFKVSAYPVRPEGGVSGGESPETLSVEEVGQELPLDSQPLERFLASSTPHGDGVAAHDVEVFIPQRVLAESVAIAREAKNVETGGVLIGKLHRAASTGDVFVEVRAQVPALHATSSAAALTFTAETWSAVRAAMELRGDDELMLGWHHYHPNFCADCPQETKERCFVSKAFFSAADCHLHRTVFSRAYQVALLLSDHGEPELGRNLFGWRQGSIVPRGFRVLDDMHSSSLQEENTHGPQ